MSALRCSRLRMMFGEHSSTAPHKTQTSVKEALNSLPHCQPGPPTTAVEI